MSSLKKRDLTILKKIESMCLVTQSASIRLNTRDGSFNINIIQNLMASS